jgi:hypothetical protein
MSKHCVTIISLVTLCSLAACSISQKGALSQAQRAYHKADYETCLIKLSQAEGYGEFSEPVSTEISFYKGLCLEGSGRKREAVAVYQNLTRNYPTSNGAVQAQERIRTINKTPNRSVQGQDLNIIR